MTMSFRNRALSLTAAVIAAFVLGVAGLIVVDYQADSRLSKQLAADGATLPQVSERLSESRTTSLDRRLALLATGGVLALVVGLGAAWSLARRLETSSQTLRDGALALASGRPLPPALPTAGYAGEIAAALSGISDRLAEREASTRWLDAVLDSIGEAVFVTAPDGRIRRVNSAAARLTGRTPEELCELDLASIIAEQDRPGFDVEAASTTTAELTILTKPGQIIPVSMTGSRMVGDDPQLQGSIFVAHDITSRKRAERRIRYLARYDSLTKVANRLQFQHSLQQAIARARRAGRSLALLYLDLDRFKEINDTFGHAAGDRTLEILSERLIAQLPKETMLGRLAGDEFGVFIENLPRDQDSRPALATLARELLEQLARPFHVDNQEVLITSSIGVALCPQDASNVIDLIRDADAAMYHSKENGGNSVSFYTPDMSAMAVERLMLKSKLRRAIERDELVMLYQPKVDLDKGRVVGAEALLRWRLPGHGDIPPSQFIPLAEESDLISEIGEWVLKHVCEDYRRWQDHVPRPGRVSINLSLKQLRQAEFIPRCRSVFEDFGVSPDNFELEITETTLMTDARRMLKLLDELRAMGLHLSIDDFGTGYSSLAALLQFPVGTLKIDRAFVQQAANSKDDATLVRTIIEMGRNLGLEVVAEGIETPAQLAFLRELRCHLGQGTLFGEPMEADALLGMLVDQAAGEQRYGNLFSGSNGGSKSARRRRQK